jgi:hypothetical protein
VKINDGQLDEAINQLNELRHVNANLRWVCARRLELLRLVVDSQIGHPANGVHVLIVLDGLWDQIESETAEHEVQPP